MYGSEKVNKISKKGNSKFNPYNAVIDCRRLNLTSVDVRF